MGTETRLIIERDHWEEKATELANDIGKALGFDVGEHSNLNCPVQTAIDGVFEMSSQIEEWQNSIHREKVQELIDNCFLAGAGAWVV